jgi:hypothetical protein
VAEVIFLGEVLRLVKQVTQRLPDQLIQAIGPDMPGGTACGATAGERVVAATTIREVLIAATDAPVVGGVHEEATCATPDQGT